MEGLFTLRKTEDGDLPLLWSLLQGEEIGIPERYGEGTSAVNGDGELVGYIYVAHTGRGPHVAPVAVFGAWRGLGVGRALMEHELQRNGSLKLVSNGWSNGFYERLGFSECGWDDIEPSFRRDCLACRDFSTCGPKPYLLVPPPPGESAPDAPGAPAAPDTPAAPNTPNTPGAPDAPGALNAPGTPGAPGAGRRDDGGGL
jgi:GNAT superfamily N-acetyltransferase